VKFSFDAIREPKHQALNLLSYIENFTKVEVIDKYTIKFTSNEKYFRNMSSLCGIIMVLPKSVYGNIDKSVKMQKEMVGSGPYKLDIYDKSQRIVIKKFDKWYGDKTEDWKGFYNFDQITFRFSKEDTITIEKLKKGDIDYHLFRTPDGFLKAKGGTFGTKVFAEKVENKQPKKLSFIGFNLKKEIFKDKNVRLAFAHLVNRDELNKKFFDNMQLLATSPVYVNLKQAPDSKPIKFDPKKAQQLLSKAGWKDEDKNGVLEKTINGKKEELRFTWIYANKDAEKWWTVIKEDLKRAGIEVELKYQEWNSFTKAIDDHNFDIIAMGWGGGDVEQDPKQIWHSTSIGKGGSNYISYSNPEVDKLIDEARSELDSAKRTVLFKKVYTLIADDVPYVFLFNPKYELYARSAKMKTPGKTFEYDTGFQAWWTTEK
jgi:ABC-type transport system substrate-binding protein